MIDHQILGLHHMHPGAGQLAWDLGFLSSGIVLVAAGALLARTGRAESRGARLNEPIPAR
jgi:uncharacterized membrane protein